MIDDPARSCGRDDQIGLTGEKGRNLQHVGDFGDRRRLAGVVDVGQDRNAEARLDAGEHREPFPQAGAAK